MSVKDHWENVYTTKTSSAVSWYQEHAETSLNLIKASGVNHSAVIIDVGGGASTLVDDLVYAGFSHISVLDLSAAALETAKNRLGTLNKEINWIATDITKAQLPTNTFDLWHDRAVFHFLTAPEQRQAYKANLLQALRKNGNFIISTFAEDGPTKCSNLDVMRYSTTELFAEFSDNFELVSAQKETHNTPFGTTQSFVYCHLRKK